MGTIDSITPHSRQVTRLPRLLGVCADSLTGCGSVAKAPTASSGAAPCRDDVPPPAALAYDIAITRAIATNDEPANRQIAITAIHVCSRADCSMDVRISCSFRCVLPLRETHFRPRAPRESAGSA